MIFGRGVANFKFSHSEFLRASSIDGNRPSDVMNETSRPGSGGLTKMNWVPVANENERDAETLLCFGSDSEVSPTNFIDLTE